MKKLFTLVQFMLIMEQFYAISKRCAEEYLLQFNKNNKLKYTILRFGSLYGERADKNNGIERIINTLVNKKLIYEEQIKLQENIFT